MGLSLSISGFYAHAFTHARAHVHARIHRDREKRQTEIRTCAHRRTHTYSWAHILIYKHECTPT